MKEVKLPELGEGIASGDVINVLVTEGSTVNRDQPLCEIETDKAVVEIPSPCKGKVTKLLVKKGDRPTIGTVLLHIDEVASDAPVADAQKPAPPAAAPEKKPEPAPAATPAAAAAASEPVTTGELRDVRVPELGEGIKAGDIINILVKEGDTVSVDQPLVEIETDKAVVEIPSPAEGVIAKILVKKGTKAAIGDTLCQIAAGAIMQPPVAQPAAPKQPAPAPAAAAQPAPPRPTPASAPAAAPKAPASAPSTTASASRPVPAGPATRRFARELGLDLGEVIGSGPGGRINIEDVKRHVRESGLRQSTVSGLHAAPAAPAAQQPLPDFSKYGPIEVKPMSSLRRKIAEQMTLAWQIPMVTHYDEADITDLDAFRRRFAARVKEVGGMLTVTSFALQAVADALLEFPQFNTSIDMANGQVIYKNYIHVGVAVDTESGLIVPVIRDVDKKSLKELCLELAQLSQKARDRKVTVEELRGGTFAISNLGGVGGTAFTPLVNPPQVAILGLARGSLRPVWRNNTFEPRLMLPLCVSYDHRVIDGADAARFTRRIVQGLEEFAGKLL